MEIKVCPTCKGKGKIEKIISDNIKDEYDDIICLTCNGTGRVYVREFTLMLPFGFENKFMQADEKLFKLMRELCQY